MAQSDVLEPIKVGEHPSVLVPTGYDNTVRWREGQSLYDLFEARCQEYERQGNSTHTAIESGGSALSYLELRNSVSAYARSLRACGIERGNHVGLVLDRSLESYCAMLAIVKLGAVYVPLDTKFPSDRIAFIAQDADLTCFVVTDDAVAHVDDIGLPVFRVSDIATKSASQTTRSADSNGTQRLPVVTSDATDSLAYIIYTSGSTGRPKGVPVNHSSICNFVIVAAEVYGYEPTDRVYQGLTFAFDFSVEELWVPLIAGATLVASPSDLQLVGGALESFLNQHRITALCCVPTLLATIEEDVPTLRFLLVSGEACPQDLVTRWSRPGRRMLNAYGPTEATVTASWTELSPHRKVTIGIPLPTYAVCLLEPDTEALVQGGQVGELAIGGIGLAVGYLNRPELTDEKFIRDFIGLENNPSARLYRTGDLARFTSDGEIEYLGRIDSQVKIKGYRIELGEIEEVLLEADGVAQAVVSVWEPEAGRKELVAYYTPFGGSAPPTREAIVSFMRSRLPAYMVPLLLEPIDNVPRLPSQKADRKSLPPPTFPRVTISNERFEEPTTATEKVVAQCLAEVLELDRVSNCDHFFDQLGLDSLKAAEVVAAIDTHLPDIDISIADIYLLPTTEELSAKLEGQERNAEPASTAAPTRIASNLSYAVCGMAQFVCYAVLLSGWLGLLIAGSLWVAEPNSASSVFFRSTQFVSGIFLLTIVVPVAAKWGLVGRWQQQDIPLWSSAYFRFWLVRLLVESSPLAMMRGSPVFNLYLRMLGARVGENVLVFSKSFPLCTDLISIGRNTVIRKDVHLTGYRAEAGYLKLGPIDIGADAIVGAGAVVDLNTSIGSGSQLGHASALIDGQAIKAQQRMHGSPARETSLSFAHQQHHDPSWLRRFLYGASQVLLGLVVAVLLLAGLILGVKVLFGFDPSVLQRAKVDFSLEIIAVTAISTLVAFAGLMLFALAIHLLVPRLIAPLLQPNQFHTLYGTQYYLAQWIRGLTNIRAFHVLFGDSSFVVGYLKLLGMRQPNVQQTGSNFGTSLQQDNPFSCVIGSGTMVSDDLILLNNEYSAGSFRVSEAQLGQRMFLGNNICYPADARVGENCLLASKVMLPVDGIVRENVGLLGSPCFEIPRRNDRDEAFDPVPKDAEGYARLAEKNGYNVRTILLYLFCNWLSLFVGVSTGILTLAVLDNMSTWALVVAGLYSVLGMAVIYLLQERLGVVVGRLQPRSCTIHDPYFWWVERHWKLAETPFKYLFRGTPFRPWLFRLLGAEVGKRVFDDGGFPTEKSLTRVGDDVCINAEVSLQAHSLEDGLFKSDRITIGSRSTIGPRGYIHYGVKLGENTNVQSDAFVMKGTITKQGSVWSGNPARAISSS